MWNCGIFLSVLSVSIRGMPRKIGFIVVSSSSHEDNFSAKELMVHAPTVNGWRSSRYANKAFHFQGQALMNLWYNFTKDRDTFLLPLEQ